MNEGASQHHSPLEKSTKTKQSHSDSSEVHISITKSPLKSVTKGGSTSTIPQNYALQKSCQSGISSQNLRVGPPPLPVHPTKALKSKPSSVAASKLKFNDQDTEMYESVHYIVTNPETSANSQSGSSTMLRVIRPAKHDFELSGNGVNPQDDPPALPIKTKPASKQQAKENDNIEMSECACYIATDLEMGTKHDSSLSPKPQRHDQHNEDKLSNPKGSNASSQMDLSPLPVCRSKAMKPESEFKQETKEQYQDNESQIYYTTMNLEASTDNIYCEAELDPMSCAKQEPSNISGNGLNPQRDHSLASGFTHKAIEFKAESCQQLNEQDDEVYESVIEDIGTRSEACSTTYEFNSGAVPRIKQTKEQFVRGSQSVEADPPPLPIRRQRKTIVEASLEGSCNVIEPEDELYMDMH